MTTLTFFNNHPLHTKITNEVAESWIGKIVPIRVLGELKGDGMITQVKVDEYGVYVTYETDAALGIRIEV